MTDIPKYIRVWSAAVEAQGLVIAAKILWTDVITESPDNKISAHH